MITFSYKNNLFKIHTKYLRKESQILQFSELGDVMIPNIEGVEIEDIKQYLNYLEMKDFIITPGFFKFSSYESSIDNHYEFPNEYMKVKLKEDLIRERFYTFELYKDPYYKLQNIDSEKMISSDDETIFYDIVEFFDGHAFIAGGSIVTGIRGGASDIDVFFYGINERKVEERIMEFIDNFPQNIEKNIVVKYSEKVVSVSFTDKAYKGNQRYEVQFIRRLYKSPSEILHGFDVDCCGFGYDGYMVWATSRAIFAYNNKIIFADPERASPSWPYRLAKYSSRGFKLYLPLFDIANFDKISFEKMIAKTLLLENHWPNIMNLLIQFLRNTSIYNSKGTYDSQTQNFRSKNNPTFYTLLKPILTPQIILILASVYGIYPGSICKILDSDYSERKMKKDQFLGKIKKGIDGYFYIERRGDYDILKYSILKTPKTLRISFDRDMFEFITFVNDFTEVSEFIKSLPWMTQNPMKQLTGSFNPQAIKDFTSWYKMTGFYGNIKEIKLKISSSIIASPNTVMILEENKRK